MVQKNNYIFKFYLNQSKQKRLYWFIIPSTKTMISNLLNMKEIFRVLLFMCLLVSFNSFGQVRDTTLPTDRKVYIRLVRDSYNGFYALGSGTFKLTKKVDLSVFTIMRNLQVGIGPTFNLKKHKIKISPLMSVTYGNKFSGSDHPIIGDALVPSLLLSRRTKASIFEVFAFWFIPTRGVTDTKSEYLWLWSNCGVKVSKTIDLGLHFETLQVLKSTQEPAGALYLWVGPNVQINFSKDAQFRLSFGKDFNAYEFMKVDFTFFVD